MTKLQRVGESVASDPERAARVADILKAVAHPLRLQIVALLVLDGELPVHVLAATLGQRQPIISQQLRILRMHRLVVASRRAGRAMYRLAEPQLRDLVRCVEGCRTH